MNKKIKIILVGILILILLLLNIIYSTKATKECMNDYLEACDNYNFCKGKIYDLKFYNNGQTIRHIVHEKDDTFSFDKNIEKMHYNTVYGCLSLTSHIFWDVGWSIQCVDVWLYRKIGNNFNLK